jgi:D-amino-acid dehydrogenase
VDAERADVAVVGGGIIGSCVAYYLARAGRDVIVLDPAPGEGSSKANAGIMCGSSCLPMANPDSLRAGLAVLRGGGSGSMSFRRPVPLRTLAWLARFAVACRPGRAWKDAARLYQLACRSQHLYDELAESEKLDLQLRGGGWTYVCHDPGVLRWYTRMAERLATVGVPHTILGVRELLDREPSVAPTAVGAVLYPDDRVLNPSQATREIARAALAHGARYINEATTEADRRDGKVRTVRTQRREISANWFVIATGARSRSVGKQFGVQLPVEAGHGISLTLPAPAQQLIRGVLMAADESVVISPGADYIRLTSGMEFGAEGAQDPAPSAVARMRTAAERTVPALRELTDGAKSWRGARPMTPTGSPFIGLVGPNVVAATGHNTLGMTLGPVTGQLVCDLITQHNGTRG